MPSTGSPPMLVPTLRRIVVEEADRVEPEVRAVRDLARDQHAGLAGADQQHAVALDAGRALLALLRLAVQPAQRADADEADEARARSSSRARRAG